MRKILIPFMLMLLFITCGKKDADKPVTNEEKIAGQTHKTWVATRQRNAEGERDKLSQDEKKQKITFSRDGNVKMGDDTQSMSGKWSTNGSTLTMQFDGADVTENFTILELTDDKVQLKADDGSELIMKPA